MQTPRTLLNRFLMLGAIAGMMAGTSCTSTKLSRVNSTSASQMPEVTALPEAKESMAPDAVQGAQTNTASEEAYAAAENTAVRVAPATSTLTKAHQESQATTSVEQTTKAPKLSLPARVAIKAVAKKLEKASKKSDIKDSKMSKMAKQLEQWLLIGIIAAAVGLILMLLTVGGASVLGLLIFLGGATLILLSLLDVI